MTTRPTQLALIVFSLALTGSLTAAEPSVTPATSPAPASALPSAPVPAAPEPVTAAPATSAGSSAESAWLQSFPAERRRSINTGSSNTAVIVWPPQKRWRGEVVLLPGPSNADHHHGPLLALAERLASTGWRCWLLAREETLDPTVKIGQAAPLQANDLKALQDLINKEAAPTDVKPEQAGKLPQFLLAQADAAALAWAESAAASSDFAGMILLGADRLPEQAPKQPVLDLQIAEQARHVAAEAHARQQRWQSLPHYQQQTLLTSSRLPTATWLGNAVDGWLRKIAAQQQTLTTDETLKKQMTAQSPSTTTTSTPATP